MKRKLVVYHNKFKVGDPVTWRTKNVSQEMQEFEATVYKVSKVIPVPEDNVPSVGHHQWLTVCVKRKDTGKEELHTFSGAWFRKVSSK